MQYLSRHCIRLTSLCRSSAAQTAVHDGSQIATASNSRHKACTALPSMTSWMVSHSVQQPGASFASEAAAEPTAVQTPTAPAQTLSKQEFAKLSLQQKKAIMKPDKNRNHFKRMWKRDMQIRNAHKTRKEQQARANAEKHRKNLERWSKGAALWQGQSTEQSL